MPVFSNLTPWLLTSDEKMGHQNAHTTSLSAAMPGWASGTLYKPTGSCWYHNLCFVTEFLEITKHICSELWWLGCLIVLHGNNMITQRSKINCQFWLYNRKKLPAKGTPKQKRQCGHQDQVLISQNLQGEQRDADTLVRKNQENVNQAEEALKGVHPLIPRI